MRLSDIFGGRSAEDEAAQQRREDSRRSLESGGLPLNAIDRLNEQKSRQNTPQHFFTSDLSTNELMLVRETGYEPLGQVMGSTIYHVGWQWQTMGWSNSSRWNGASAELAVLTAAFRNARSLALGRLAQEAALLGATGVVGVRLERQEYEWGAGLLEFAAIGTAIREIGVEPQAIPSTHTLFLSDLSGEDYWALRQAGFRPVGIAIGNCTYYQIPSWSSRQVTTGGFFNSGSWVNQELPDYTQALYNARELAMGRMEDEARTFGASGIVGVTVEVDAEPHEIESNNQRRVDMLYHFTAIGTAIAPYRWKHTAPDILPILPLKSSVRNSNERIELGE
jgi:uncharacterized protein YbjQ (UPF0145 family)